MDKYQPERFVEQVRAHGITCSFLVPSPSYLCSDEHDPTRPQLMASCGRPLPGSQVELLWTANSARCPVARSASCACAARW
jgi:non-ribosomal peptide synthetase component F